MEREKLKSVLLVDDDHATNIINSHTLKKHGISDSFTMFDDGIHALDYLSNISLSESVLPELIILDINMPVMSGWEFIDEFKKLPNHITSNCQIILHSTTVDPMDHMKAKKVGIPLLHKPMNLKSFLGTILISTT